MGFDLSLLGESFVGFNDVFKELFEISEISGELEVKTLRISEGSIITEIYLNVLALIPFENIKHYQNFLQFSNSNLLKDLNHYFSQFENAHKTLNDYFKENQFDLQVVTILITLFITKMVG